MNLIKLLFYFHIYLFLLSSTELKAVDFEDLEETRVKVYGSEKDKKYRLDGFFIEWENWPKENPTHNHFHFFWFANTTDYPKYKKDQIFPFYYSIESKVDKRKSTNYLLLAGSSIDEKEEKFKYFFPFYFQKSNQDLGLESTSVLPIFHISQTNYGGNSTYDLILPGYIYNEMENRNNQIKKTFSLSPFHISSKSYKLGKEENTSWYPIVPLYYISENTENIHRNYLWLIDTNYSKADQSLNRFWFLPFFFYEKENYKYIIPFYFHNTTSETGSTTNSWFGIIPPIYRSYSPNHSKFYLLNFYTSLKNIDTTQDSFTMFFPFWIRSSNANNYSETIIPILYYNETKPDSESHTNILAVYDHKFNKEGELSRLWLSPFFFYEKENYKYIIPFYFHNTTSKTGSTTNSWFGIIPPIYRSYSPNHSKFYLLNFYTSELNSKTSQDSFTMFFPFWIRSSNANNYSETIIPILYYNETKPDSESHTNILALYDHKFNKEGELSRLWLSPFFFYEKENYKYIIPFYFHNTTSETGSTTNSWFGIIPPIYRSYSPNHSKFYLLNFYTSELNSKTSQDSFTMFFPFWFRSSNANNYSETIIPILYYNETKPDSESHTNILALYDHKFDKEGELSRLWLSPFFFYEKENYKYIIPFYFHNTTSKTGSTTNFWFGIIPPIYRSYSPNHSKFYLLNFYTSELNSKTSQDSFTMFFPFWFRSSNANNYSETIIPILYYNETKPDSESHTNILAFYDHKFNKEGELSRLWFAPFYFYEKANFTLINPLYFQKYKTEENGFDLTLSFLYMDYEGNDIRIIYKGIYYESEIKTKVRLQIRKHFFPLYYSWNNQNKKIETNEYLSEEGYLFLPFIYKNKTEDNKTFTNILAFINYTEDDQSLIEKLNVFPIRFYKKDHYSVWFPFSFRLGSEASDAGDGTHFGTFFYHNWNDQFDKLWILNYYSNEDKVEGHDTRVFFPAYYSWDREKTKGQLFLPVYLDLDVYNEESKVFDNYNINILGIATQSSRGIFQTDIALDVGKKSKYYYLDTDISWLYYAFRISNRVSTKYIQDLFSDKEDSEFVKEEISKLESSKINPKLIQKKEFTRDDSYNFFGLNILFGVFGYEAADSKRHIRLLPLAWLTYDTNADDNIYAGPLPLPFVWYTAPEIEYRIIFPVYGFQKSNDAERQSYGLFLFLQEAVLEDSRMETSIIWPLINIHSSDSKKGSRVIPLYWQRTSYGDSEISDSTIVPLGLTYVNRTTYKDGQEFDLWVSPFVYRKEHNDKDKKSKSIFSPLALFYYGNTITDETEDFSFYSPLYFRNSIYKSDQVEKSKWFLPFPLLYHSEDRAENSSFWNLLLFASYESSTSHDTYAFFPIAKFNFSKNSDKIEYIKRNWFFPFFYSQNQKKQNFDKSFTESSNFYSPVYISSKKNNQETYIYPLFGYYSESSEDSKYWNWMFILSQKSNPNSNSITFFPFYHSSKTANDSLGYSKSKQWLAPIYYSSFVENKNGKTLEDSFYSIIYANEKSYDGKTDSPISSFSLIPILFLSYSHSQGMDRWNWLYFIQSEKSQKGSTFNILPIFHNGNKLNETGKEISSGWLFPIYYYDQETDSKNSLNQSTTFFSLIYNSLSVKNSSNPEKKSSITFIPIIPIYYHSEKDNSEYTNFLYILQWEITKDQLSNFILFPFYYQNDEFVSGRKEKYFHFIPFYFSKSTPEDFEALICGLYIDKTKNSSYYNLFFIAEHERDHNNSSVRYNFLLRSIHYENTPELFDFSLLYGFSEIEVSDKSTSANLLWISHEKKEKSFYQNILPIYYYNDTEKESTFWLTPFLYYFSKDQKSKIEHSVGGLVYYNEEDFVTKKSLSNILLGIVYYKTVKPSERGYVGRGSLWGAVWEYNTEEETNYSKFSILKILYSRRVDADGVTNRILFFEF